jgi:8-oxo-dGTP diphosphatase
MESEFRISAGAIVIHEEKILLVRYIDAKGKNYLVGPGGGVLFKESATQAVIREVIEETGVNVSPLKPLYVEDLLYPRYRIIKLWFLCQPVGGKLAKTMGAIQEGITEAGWFSREQLQNEVVYPDIIKKYSWDEFNKNNWQAKYAEMQEINVGF